MTGKVNTSPAVSQIAGVGTVSALVQTVSAFASSVYTEFAAHARRLNLALTIDGEETMMQPLRLLSSTVAGLSGYPATSWEGSVIYVSDETGGKTLAFSDGTDWRRAQDRVVVS